MNISKCIKKYDWIETKILENFQARQFWRNQNVLVKLKLFNLNSFLIAIIVIDDCSLCQIDKFHYICTRTVTNGREPEFDE